MEPSMTQFRFMSDAEARIVWWPCTIREPLNSEGETREWRESTLTVQFRALPIDEIDALMDEGGAFAVIERAVVDWRAVTDDGAAVPLSRFAQLARVPYVRDGIFAGFVAFVRGAPEGN